MMYSVFAAGFYGNGEKFLHQFETKRDARTWAAQNHAVITKLWAVYEKKAA